MRKIIVFFSLMVVIAIILQSCASIENLACGIGIGKSSIVGESDSWDDPVGVQAGASMPVVDLSESINLNAGLQATFQGAKWEESYYGGGTLSGKVNLIYLNAPLLVRYKFKNKFYAEAGLQPGFLLSAKDKYEGQTDDYKDYMNKFDLAIPFGGGYEFSNNFGIGLQIVPGITNINSEGDAKDRNFLVALRGTYTFGKTK
jgi:hypothetical protein